MSQADLAARENRRSQLKRNSSAPSSTPETADDSLRRPSLRRGSSFTFLTPGPWDFTLKKRKRRAKDDDVISLCSLDIKEGIAGPQITSRRTNEGHCLDLKHNSLDVSFRFASTPCISVSIQERRGTALPWLSR
ncbi:neuroepithelial cell-transforming gene 1 protein-like [Hypanus sabinus]|uniref:neuroepithelial cell-transforming gene 1 protein-like n=1 Tax=Hypanus sabinus TaxID=79690 RepID=UPI0028C3F124|nr:neuroepithelial cell-transforming gene 1 protein-like [Hypanus sabinus]